MQRKSFLLGAGRWIAIIVLLWVMACTATMPAADEVEGAATTDDLVFIHHSCGSNWLSHSLNAALVAKEYIDERNDITYGAILSSDAGRPDSLGETPGDSTNMDHWIRWFNDYLNGIKQHGAASGVNRIIMFKSCYPISNVTADGSEPGDPFSGTQTITNYKAVYRHPDGTGHTYTNDSYTYYPLEDIFAANPGTLFIAITAPPRHYAPSDATDNAEAHRARLFNNWLKGDWLNSYNAAHPGLHNVAVFDWFDLLAYPDDDTAHPNRLKAEYGGEGGDSHPNDTANAYSTQIFATGSGNFIDAAWAAFDRQSYTIHLPMVTRAYVAARPWPDTSSGIFVFNDQLDTSSLSDAQAQFAATHYAGAQKLTRAAARRLRQYNSDFLVLHYRLGQALGYRMPDSFCQPTGIDLEIIDGDNWVQEWPGDEIVQESWFFQWNSSRVFNCDYGHYLMDLDDSGWRSWWSEQVIQQLQDNENDGLFADSYNIPNYGFTWNPALPAVDASFELAWATRQHDFSDYIRGQFAGRWKWIPNIGAYITSRDPSDYTNVDGVMIEGFAEWGGENYFDLSDWQLQMDRLLPLIAADKIVIGQTYPNADNVDERLFVLGTFLLIKGRYTYINLDVDMSLEWFPEYGIDLGAPADALPTSISEYLDSSWNVYVRHYAKGMVMVNPEDSARTVNLGATYYLVTPSGGGSVPDDGAIPGSLSYQAVTTLALEPHCAAILLDQAP